MNPVPAHDDSRGFSIIIPVYNGEKSLPDTLRSVSGLDYDSYEIIVVDDASTDKTAEIAAAWGAKVIRLEHNQGPAAARNIGAQQSNREILLFSDSDVLLPKQTVRLAAQRFQESGVDAVQGTFSDVCPYGNFFSQYKNLYNRYVLNQLPDWIDTTFTSLTAVRRSAFLACGGFDANIRSPSVEDRTLGRNLIRHGFRIRMDRGIEVIHNKRLTWWGFVRNQYRRSRDLAKLLLRSRLEKVQPDVVSPASVDSSGRFGTNAPSTMIRIPIAYLTIFFILLAIKIPILSVFSVAFTVLFLYLIAPFVWYLLKLRGVIFVLQSILANFLDAWVSGVGGMVGLFEFILLGKRY